MKTHSPFPAKSDNKVVLLLLFRGGLQRVSYLILRRGGTLLWEATWPGNRTFYPSWATSTLLYHLLPVLGPSNAFLNVHGMFSFPVDIPRFGRNSCFSGGPPRTSGQGDWFSSSTASLPYLGFRKRVLALNFWFLWLKSPLLSLWRSMWWRNSPSGTFLGELFLIVPRRKRAFATTILCTRLGCRCSGLQPCVTTHSSNWTPWEKRLIEGGLCC